MQIPSVSRRAVAFLGVCARRRLRRRRSRIGYQNGMSKTSLEIDRDIATQAARILGTKTLRDTVDASLREIVNAKRRLELVALLSEPGRYDIDALDGAWGGDD